MLIAKEAAISFFVDTIEMIVLSLALFLVVYIFLVQPHQVNGHSMDSTLETGQYLLTEKLSYRFREPKRGEIVVFHAPKVACVAGDCDYIKRIIGLPGDKIKVEAGHFYVNGELLDESNYLPASVETNEGFYTADAKEITLGEDQYFVSGDNRPGSSDSRIWGPITRDSIVGRAIFSYWPVRKFGVIEQGTYGSTDTTSAINDEVTLNLDAIN